MRAHPLMYHPVYPIHRRPLVVRTGVDYRFTALVVDQVDAVDARYEVLFLGTGECLSVPGQLADRRTSLHVGISHFVFCPNLTWCHQTSLVPDRGTVQKVIVLPKDPSTMEELTLEEVEVFRVCL